MRKRRNPVDEESSSEMDVEGEEKEGQDDDASEEEIGDDEGDGHEMPRRPAMLENPFLDSFYMLSSEDPKERSKAAQTMLQHCLLGPTANSKDAAYAFRRLLNGLCSGRAAARQGNASALSSFLNLAFQLGKMEEIRDEQGTDDANANLSMLTYVRHRLIAATDPNQTTGKKKGSEERDYQFGRLFGILSIVRSTVLASQGKEKGNEDSKLVATALASDLVDLFWLKRWMREPAAHAITTLLRAFCDPGSEKGQVASHLVHEVIVPKILLTNANGDEGDSDHTSLVGSFGAEQLGIALFIQSQSVFQAQELPFPLDQSCLSTDTLSLVAQALSETSVVVQPRTHFVWDTIWNYLSKSSDEPGKKRQRGPEKRELRDCCPLGHDSTREVVELIVRQVVVQKLLCLDPEKSTGKATHERRALAMSIVKVLSGTPYVSSASGVSLFCLERDILEQCILSPEIVRALFVDVICAGSEKKKTSHLLKPLALEVLKEISQALAEDPSEDRRLAAIKALLNCELRFDARTKTTTVSDLLELTKAIQDGNLDSKISFWNGHLEQLLSSFFAECAVVQDDQRSARATGCVELIYSFAKHVLRLQTVSDTDQSKLDDFKRSIADQVLQFFLASAFFNCEGVIEAGTPKKKKGKKSRKESENPMHGIANRLKQTHSKGAGVVHAVRSVISARFFSLLADFSAYSTHAVSEDSSDKVEKDSTTLSVLVRMKESWESLQSLGAQRFSSEAKHTKDEDDVDPEKIITEIQGAVKSATEALSKDSGNVTAYANKRCCTGIAALAYALYLHRLSCGESEQANDDPDADAENDEEEICNSLESLKDVCVGFLQKADDDHNPLAELAENCANLLSSPLGSGNMGRAASPKLIRETIKFAWLGGLRRASSLATEDKSLFDASVTRVLLDAVGAAPEMNETVEDGSDEEMDDEDDDSDNEGPPDDDDVFAKAMDVDEGNDESKSEDKDDGDESDVELDATKLQSMLEEDSDVDGEDGVLEHHEGADAALAKLIRLRQETRKAGKKAREKIELGHQLRCTFLLELLFGRLDSWNRVFQTETLLDVIIPMLRYRKKLERSLKKSREGGDMSNENEKQALVDRLTSILSQRICKLKISSLRCAKPLDAGRTLEFTTKVLDEARRAESKEQTSCCCAALVFVLRSSAEPSSSSDLLNEAALEWSTKRTTKLEAILFHELIIHLPEWSAQVLLDPLIEACGTARSAFLKSECFRLLTTQFSTQSSHGAHPFLASVESALQDEEMRKAKRVRVVLKALEKYLVGLSTKLSSETVRQWDKISHELLRLAEGDSQGVSAICRKLVSDMETKQTELQQQAAAAEEEVVEAKESTAVAGVGGDMDLSSKKKKKKKKKR